MRDARAGGAGGSVALLETIVQLPLSLPPRDE